MKFELFYKKDRCLTRRLILVKQEEAREFRLEGQNSGPRFDESIEFLKLAWYCSRGRCSWKRIPLLRISRRLMDNDYCNKSDLRETVDPDTKIQKAVVEDSEPRIARIRENLKLSHMGPGKKKVNASPVIPETGRFSNGLGPFDLMADIIVGSQHGPNNSGLFGVVQSPIRPLRPSFVSSLSTSSTSEPQLTSSQMAQKMQNIIDVPLLTIHTNLPFKKNQERKSNATKSSETNIPFISTGVGSGKSSTTSDRTNDSSYRKRKRKRSDYNNTDTENWQKPCTSSTTAKMEYEDNKMTISELFGEEKLETGNGKKRPWEKDEQESPDSGFADEINDQNREQFHRLPLQTIIGELSHISPLLTPPRHPQKNNGPTLPVIINLDRLDSAQLLRIKNVFIKNAPVFLSTVALPDYVLSPPVLPTLKMNEMEHYKFATLILSWFPKVVQLTAMTTAVTPAKKFIVQVQPHRHRALRKNLRRNSQLTTSEFVPKIVIIVINVNESIPRCGSASNDDRKHEPATLKMMTSKSHLLREKEKYTTFRIKGSNGLSDQFSSGTTTVQLRELKKKQVSDTTRIVNDNMRVKIVKSSKCKDGDISPTKKFKKDTSVRNKFTDGVKEISDDFLCYRSHTAPAKKTILEKNDDGSYKCANYYLDEIARPLKHRADKESGDYIRKTLAYMDAAVYFILSSATERENRQRQYTIARDSAELMKTIIKWSGASTANLSPLERHFISRFRILSFRVQAVLNYYLYSLKIGSCMSNFGALTKWEPQLTELDAAAMRNDGAASVSSQGDSSANTETPSPASSTNSGHGEHQKDAKMLLNPYLMFQINIPVSIYQAQRSQLSILHHLMWSDRLWKQTSTKISSSEQEMVKHLDQICGPLTVDLNLHLLSEYLATAVTWLRMEYRAEKGHLSPS
ncbi:AF4/FMR2 family member 4 [Dirofilaria immitis]|nr:AF4/FMR2 family member 4 [Dirofilaria immitis]